AGVPDLVQLADDLLERDVAVTERDEVPPAPHVAVEQVTVEDAVAAVEVDVRVLQVHVVDAVTELVEEGDRVDALPLEVAGIEIQTEPVAMPDRFERARGRPEVERDL